MLLNDTDPRQFLNYPNKFRLLIRVRGLRPNRRQVRLFLWIIFYLFYFLLQSTKCCKSRLLSTLFFSAALCSCQLFTIYIPRQEEQEEGIIESRKAIRYWNHRKMRKRAGIGAIKQRQLDTEKFREKGNELAETQLKQLSGQLEQFRTNLETFATDHKQEIRSV